MTDVIKAVDVAKPVGVVYAQYSQFEKFPRFMEGVERVTRTGQDLLHWEIEIGGAKREFDTKITEHIPEKRIAWKSVAGKDHAGVVTFHRLSDQASRITVQMSYDPEGFLENVADAVGVITHRVEGDLERFKSYVEEGARA